MMLKRYIDFLNETYLDPKEYGDGDKWIMSLTEECIDCDGTGLNQDGVKYCYDCEGSGFHKYITNDGDKEYDNCEICNGSGEVEVAEDEECEFCNKEGKVEWLIYFTKGKGPEVTYSKDESRSKPESLKRIIYQLFTYRHVTPRSAINKLVRFMIEDGSIDRYEIDENSLKLLNDETKRILSGHKSINKYNL